MVINNNSNAIIYVNVKLYCIYCNDIVETFFSLASEKI